MTYAYLCRVHRRCSMLIWQLLGGETWHELQPLPQATATVMFPAALSLGLAEYQREGG